MMMPVPTFEMLLPMKELSRDSAFWFMPTVALAIVFPWTIAPSQQ